MVSSTNTDSFGQVMRTSTPSWLSSPVCILSCLMLLYTLVAEIIELLTQVNVKEVKNDLKEAQRELKKAREELKEA